MKDNAQIVKNSVPVQIILPPGCRTIKITRAIDQDENLVICIEGVSPDDAAKIANQPEGSFIPPKHGTPEDKAMRAYLAEVIADEVARNAPIGQTLRTL